eukprot:CAMPEP_0179005040 /NCGR_PEP_ID=MMETSP0795-20121207/13668_1 /TAXON_ID=88552 /ORGANISM="Amoebophrya sp., Strain Ameob2" /LENGTH=564 /DNA_ID=CAMNT_0020699427 /DNA_START=447 /DNA_END=2138 /DNA_ORIENTATION=+
MNTKRNSEVDAKGGRVRSAASSPRAHKFRACQLLDQPCASGRRPSYLRKDVLADVFLTTSFNERSANTCRRGIHEDNAGGISKTDEDSSGDAVAYEDQRSRQLLLAASNMNAEAVAVPVLSHAAYHYQPPSDHHGGHSPASYEQHRLNKMWREPERGSTPSFSSSATCDYTRSWGTVRDKPGPPKRLPSATRRKATQRVLRDVSVSGVSDCMPSKAQLHRSDDVGTKGRSRRRRHRTRIRRRTTEAPTLRNIDDAQRGQKWSHSSNHIGMKSKSWMRDTPSSLLVYLFAFLHLFLQHTHAATVVNDFFPKKGSLEGGLQLRVTGDGFLDPNRINLYSSMTVYLGAYACPVMLPMSTMSELICITPKVPEPMDVTLEVLVISDAAGGGTYARVRDPSVKFSYTYEQTPVVKFISHFGLAVGDFLSYGARSSTYRRQQILAQTWSQTETRVGGSTCLSDELLIANRFSHTSDNALQNHNHFIERIGLTCRLQGWLQPGYGRFDLLVRPNGLNDVQKCSDLQCTCQQASDCPDGYGKGQFLNTKSDQPHPFGLFTIGVEAESAEQNL